MKILSSTGLLKLVNLIVSGDNTSAPTGCIYAFSGSSIPSGWLLCDGSTINRTTYSKLFSVIGTTYGTGNGSSTFNLPNLTNKFIEGSSTSGISKNAGLPNITGTTRLEPNIVCNVSTETDTTIGTTAGAFSSITESYPQATIPSNTVSAPSYNHKTCFTFNASNSSSIYGASSTVQPSSLTMKYIIKY